MTLKKNNFYGCFLEIIGLEPITLRLQSIYSTIELYPQTFKRSYGLTVLLTLEIKLVLNE